MQKIWTMSVERAVWQMHLNLMNLSKLTRGFIKVINLMSYFFSNNVILW